MATRSAASLLASFLLFTLGCVLGLGVFRGFERFKATMSKETEIVPPKPMPAPTSPQLQKKGFWQNVRFIGSLSSDGWKGAAVYTDKWGSTLKLGSRVSKRGVDEVKASVGYKGHDWEWEPDLEVTASVAPGTKGVQYVGKISKKLDMDLEPTLYSQLSNNGASMGVLVSKTLGDVDLAVDLRAPVSARTRKVDLTLDGTATYKVGEGKVVGKLKTRASSGLRGTDVTASYNLGA